MRCWWMLVVSGWLGAASGANARFTAVVVDEAGRPMPGMKVIGGFTHNIDYAMGGLGTDWVPGVTDAEGRCRLEGDISREHACFRLEPFALRRLKKYYQPFEATVRYDDRDFFGNWLPQDQVVTAIVQRIEHPIPLIVRNTLLTSDTEVKQDLFSLGQGKLQYDFMVGDWLPPVGTGLVADVECVLHAEEVPIPKEELRYYLVSPTSKTTRLEQWVDVTFPGPDNGAQLVVAPQSVVLPVRQAPEDGYRQYMGRFDEDERRSWRPVCYAFRIRTRRDAAGKIVSCHYGKLFNGFQPKRIERIKRWGVVSTIYYLNPTPLDRNLEWDREHSLLPTGDGIYKYIP